jgi:hypothetical protein
VNTLKRQLSDSLDCLGLKLIISKMQAITAGHHHLLMLWSL